MAVSTLPLRPSGSSGLDITPVGFGAWDIGGGDGAFGWGPQDDDASLERVLPLEPVARAHERLDSGHGRGKIVLTVEEGAA